MSKLTSVQVARRGGVNLESIRFYEREGLLPKAPRGANGYRAFTEDDVRRVRFIKRAQELGFSLKEIGELLELRNDAGSACSRARTHANEKIAQIECKIRELRKIRLALLQLTKTCNPARKSGCAILEKLETDGE